MRKFIYLLPFAIMALSSCLKSNNNDTTPIAVPSGTFTGVFKELHLKKNSSTGYDTTRKINYSMTISTSTGYKATGDTSTFIAGSYGDFQIYPTQVYFYDTTFPKTGTPTKVHLSGGPYNYAYDGSRFQFYLNLADTLIYYYDLKKTN